MIDDMNTESQHNAPEKRRRVTILAWVWCGFVILAAVAVGLSALLNRPVEESVLDTLANATTLAGFVAFAITGALVISRQPRNVVGWLLMIEGSLAIIWPVDLYFNNLVQPPANPSLLFITGLWFWGWLWLWLIFPILFLPLYFPTGSPPSLRWRWVSVLGLGLCAFFILYVSFSPNWESQDGTWTVANPVGFLQFEFPLAPWVILLLSFAALSVASLLVRFRRAQPVEREQIKWLLYAAGLFFVIYSITFVTSNAAGPVADLGGVLLFLGMLTFPVAIAISILRYRLYDIDVIIRKTLVYAVLTALLGLVYFGSVVLLQQLFGAITGIEQSPLAIVVSTLIIAALFTPLRRRIQDWIDRRFFRKKYDAQQVLARFALTARDETDLDALTAELVRVVQETMQPEHVSVWLRSTGDQSK